MSDIQGINTAATHAAEVKKPRTKRAGRENPSPSEPTIDSPAPGTVRGKKAPTKADRVFRKLALHKGASIEDLVGVTGWQAHSVRGFISATVKKKLGRTVVSEVGKDGVRRYRIAGDAPVAG